MALLIDDKPRDRPPLVTLSQLWDMEFPPQPCWIGGPDAAFLPKGGKLLLGGLPKIGKSWFLAEISRAAASNTPLFWHPSYQGGMARVLLVDEELGLRTMKNRTLWIFKGYEDCSDRIAIISKNFTIKLDNIQGCRELCEYIDDFQPNVLVLDPMDNLHDGDENDNSSIGRIFNNINEIIGRYEKNEMSVVMAHHFKKVQGEAKGHDSLSPHNFRGAGRWYGYPDTLMTMDRVAELNDGRGWELRARPIFRHSEPMGDLKLVFNHDGTHRVLWQPSEDMPPVKPEPPPIKKLFG